MNTQNPILPSTEPISAVQVVLASGVSIIMAADSFDVVEGGALMLYDITPDNLFKPLKSWAHGEWKTAEMLQPDLDDIAANLEILESGK